LNVERSGSARAVFLSYASQDAEAAKRICEALRAAGVEVWFDQSELRGGDVWDAKIKRQIKECALFVPVITTNTNARPEGYFRLEWKLAVDRSHLLADDHPFLFPIVIGDINDVTARVPDKFRDVQWTRLRLDETPAELAGRITRLLAGSQPAEAREQRTEASDKRARRRDRPAWLRHAWSVMGLIIVAYYGLRPLWRADRHVETDEVPRVTAPAAPASVSEARQLAARALEMITKVGFTRDDLGPAEDLARRATEKEPDSAAAWGVRAGVQSAWLFRGWDNSEKRRQDTQSFANHALALDPNEPEALLALGHVLRTQGAYEQAEAHLRRAVAVNPDHIRLARALGYTLGQHGREAEARTVLFDAVKRAPRDPLLRYELAMTYTAYGAGGSNPENVSAAIEQLDAAIAIQPFASAEILKAALIGGWRGDLAAMRVVLDQHDKLPFAERSEDRSVCVAMWAGLMEHRPDRVEAAAALTARTYFDDFVMPFRPKAWSLALAHRLAGKDNLERNDWQAAETALRQRLRDDPTNEKFQVELAITLAWLGRRDEAARLVEPIEPVWREDFKFWRPSLLARYYAALGDAAKAAPYLIQEIDRNVFTSRKIISLDPWWDKLRGQPEFEALLKEASASMPAGTLTPKTDEKSVAVLAFANLSDDKGNEYFSDGISEELLTVLLKIPGLKVSARTSAFSLKGREVTVQEVGRILGVAYVIEGSVRKAGGKVRVTGRLSRTDTGQQLWSENYTRDLEDVFALQTDLAQMIVGQLRGQLTGEPAGGGPEVAGQITAAQRGGTTKVAAHELYLQGKFFAHQPSIDNLARAEDCFQRAVDQDPAFALAWAALGRTSALRGEYEEATAEAMREKFARARRATDRALALAPNLPEAYFARFEIQSAYDFDWRAARESLEQALRLSPADAMLISNASQQAAIFGDLEKSLQLGRQAAELDPVNAEVRYWLSRTLVALGRLAEGEAELRHAMEFSPSLLSAHRQLSTVLVLQGRFDEAVKEARLEKSEWSRVAALSVACWAARDRPAADAALARLIEVGSELSAYQVAETYAFRGEINLAFDWLEKAYRNRDAGLGAMRSDPLLRVLHEDPRWPAFLKKVGLADDQLK